MSKATELADNFEECPLNYLGEVAPMLRQQDEAIRVALEALEYMNVTAEHKVDNAIPKAAIKLLREVQG